MVCFAEVFCYCSEYMLLRFAVEGWSAAGSPVIVERYSSLWAPYHHPCIWGSFLRRIVDKIHRQHGVKQSCVFISHTFVVVAKMFSPLGWIVGRDQTKTLYECRRCRSTFETDTDICPNCQPESIGRVAKSSRVCLWYSQLRGHSSLLFWLIAGPIRRGIAGSEMDQRISRAEAGATPLVRKFIDKSLVASQSPLEFASGTLSWEVTAHCCFGWSLEQFVEE